MVKTNVLDKALKRVFGRQSFSRLVQIKSLTSLDGDSTVPSSKHYGELTEMLENPWIYRVWTIQEMGPARKRIVQRGDMTRPWLRFDIVRTPLLTTKYRTTSGSSNRSELAKLFHILIAI